MTKLADSEKFAIVTMLAQFRTPTDIARHLSAKCGQPVSIQQITKYDPTRLAFDAGEKWRQLFDAARSSFLSEASKVPIANQAYRLNMLQELFENAKSSRNWKLAASFLEQAAREIGGALTNKQSMQLTDDRPRIKDMSHEERTQMLGAIISDALHKQQTQP